MSETLVSRLRLRQGWSQGRSQALRPTAKTPSISLKFWDHNEKVSVSVSMFETNDGLCLRQKSKHQSQFFLPIHKVSVSIFDTKFKSHSLSVKNWGWVHWVSVSIWKNWSRTSLSKMFFKIFWDIWSLCKGFNPGVRKNLIIICIILFWFILQFPAFPPGCFPVSAVSSFYQIPPAPAVSVFWIRPPSQSVLT